MMLRIAIYHFFHILHDQYRTEPFGPWQTREAYPWEYDTKIQERALSTSRTLLLYY